MKKIIIQTALMVILPYCLSSQDYNNWNGSKPYGDQPAITQLDGYGNNNNILELKQASIDTILSGFPWRDYSPDYKSGYGPIDVKVINPSNLQAGIYYVKFDSVSYILATGILKENDGKTAKWYIYNEQGDTVFSDHWINYNNEQLIPGWGISITMNKIEFPGDETEYGGFQGAAIEFENPSKPWLKFLADTDIAPSPTNWIRSGSMEDPDNSNLDDYGDPNEYFEQILDGKWAPYKIASHSIYGPAFITGHALISYLKQRVASVDIVITNDTTKWTRSPVFEMCENDSIDTNGDGINDLYTYGPSGVYKFDLRNSPSVNKSGSIYPVGSGSDTLTNSNLSNYIGSTGMSWFPGYAIDIETGVRLNIGFGENSWYNSQNGNDMLWNPTGELYSSLYVNSGGTAGYPFLGGMHNIYIFGQNHIETSESRQMFSYDAGRTIFERMQPEVSNGKRDVFRNAMWVSIPYLDTAYSFLETDLKIKIRMSNPYKVNANAYQTLDTLNSHKPMWKFDLSEFSSVPETQSTNSKTTVYPNPASDLVNIIFPHKGVEKPEIIFRDLSGRIIEIDDNKKLSQSSNHFQIDISDLSPGIVIFSVLIDNRIEYCGKITVIR